MGTPFPIVTKYWEMVDRGQNITKFVVTAAKMSEYNPTNPTQQLIHWRCGGAYKVDGLWRSTSFDTKKLRTDDPRVRVELISKKFDMSGRAAYNWEKALAEDFTTTDVYNLMVSKKVNFYLYNGNGSGCLTWTTALVRLLETEGVLPPGSTEELLQAVDVLRNGGEYWVPDEPGAKFYD